MPGRLALVGSGEFLPGMATVDAALLRDRPRRVAVLPTAAAPEGDAVIARWLDLAVTHYAGLGAEVVAVDVRDRDAAHDPANVALVSEDLGLLYLSGGNPSFLAATLRETPLWAAVHRAWTAGVALAGCSAGAMVLGSDVLSPPWRGGRGGVAGTGVLPDTAIVPHFDRFGARFARATRLGVERGARVRMIGVDEDTALVHDPETGWRVDGAGGVWDVRPDGVVPLDGRSLDLRPG